jgi:hypothetical protein
MQLMLQVHRQFYYEANATWMGQIGVKPIEVWILQVSIIYFII